MYFHFTSKRKGFIALQGFITNKGSSSRYLYSFIIWKANWGVYIVRIMINFLLHILLHIRVLSKSLTLSWRRSLPYRIQSVDMQSKSMDWCLYDGDLRHEVVSHYRKHYTIDLVTFIEEILNGKLQFSCSERSYIMDLYQGTKGFFKIDSSENSSSQMFFKIDVLKNWAIFTKKTPLLESLFK